MSQPFRPPLSARPMPHQFVLQPYYRPWVCGDPLSYVSPSQGENEDGPRMRPICPERQILMDGLPGWADKFDTVKKLCPHPGSTETMAFVEQGNYMVTAGQSDRMLRIYREDNDCGMYGQYEPVASVPLKETITALNHVYNTQDRFMVTGSASGRLQLLDLERPERPLVETAAHTSRIRGIAANQSSFLHFSVSDDGTARAWDWRVAGPSDPVLSFSGRLTAVAGPRFRHDVIAFGSDTGTCWVFDIRMFGPFDCHVLPENEWESAGKKNAATPMNRFRGPGDLVTSIAWAGQVSNHLAVSYSGNSIMTYDIYRHGRVDLAATRPPNTWTRPLVTMPDGSKPTGPCRGEIHIPGPGICITPPPPPEIEEMPNENTEWLQRFTGHRNLLGIQTVAFTGPMDDIVISGCDSGHMFLWDRPSGEVVSLLEVDRLPVTTLAPHPFKPLVAAASAGTTVAVYSADVDARRAHEIILDGPAEPLPDQYVGKETLLQGAIRVINEILAEAGIAIYNNPDNNNVVDDSLTAECRCCPKGAERVIRPHLTESPPEHAAMLDKEDLVYDNRLVMPAACPPCRTKQRVQILRSVVSHNNRFWTAPRVRIYLGRSDRFVNIIRIRFDFRRKFRRSNGKVRYSRACRLFNYNTADLALSRDRPKTPLGPASDDGRVVLLGLNHKPLSIPARAHRPSDWNVFRLVPYPKFPNFDADGDSDYDEWLPPGDWGSAFGPPREPGTARHFRGVGNKHGLRLRAAPTCAVDQPEVPAPTRPKPRRARPKGKSRLEPEMSSAQAGPSRPQRPRPEKPRPGRSQRSRRSGKAPAWRSRSESSVGQSTNSGAAKAGPSNS